MPTQVELLEKWVSEEAGGMIAVAGPIQTAKWIRSTEHAKLRDLYPVVFQQRLTLLDDGQYGGETPWPLAIERAGREAKFLWLGNTAEESEAAWDSFPGVYGYYAVKGEKPGATVYARFSDPEAGAVERAARVLRQPVLRRRPGVLHRQRRAVAAAAGRPGVLRSAVHEADSPRQPGPHPARLVARLAARGARSL